MEAEVEEGNKEMEPGNKPKRSKTKDNELD
jgi:hypothetical protein